VSSYSEGSCDFFFKILVKIARWRWQHCRADSASANLLHSIILSTFQMSSIIKRFDLVNLDFRHGPKFEF
jgi:hypothetical protein